MTDSKEWQATEDKDSEIHVIPLNDLEAHTSVNCPCNPTMEPVTIEFPLCDGPVRELAGFVYSHNAYDRRELHEPGPVC